MSYNILPDGTMVPRGGTITANFAVNVNTMRTFYIDATSGNISVTLPSASGISEWEGLFIRKDASGNTVTITGTVSGSANPTLSGQYKYLRVKCDGTAFYNVGSN